MVALLPKAGNQEIFGDVNDLPDDLNKNTVHLSSNFILAGEVEIIDVNENHFAPSSSIEVAWPKRRKTSA